MATYDEIIKQGIEAVAESFNVMTPQKMAEFNAMTMQPGFERTEAAVPSWKSALGMGGRAKTFVQRLPEEATNVLNTAKTYVGELPRGQGIRRPAPREGVNTSGKSWNEITEEARLGLSRQGPKGQTWEEVAGSSPAVNMAGAPVEKTLWNTAGKTTAALTAGAAAIDMNKDAFNGQPAVNKGFNGNPSNMPIAGVSPSPIGVTIPEHGYVNPPPLEGTYLTKPFAGGINPSVNPVAPVMNKTGQGGASAPTENFPPAWATKNGWNMSHESKDAVDAKGIGITPKGEQPTAVRISTKDRTGKGMNAAVRLETDNADTTLVANPTFGKGIVDENGYAHVDNRKYIEKENWGKGEKVPLLQGIGIGKRDEGPGGIEQAIKDIKNDPNMHQGGGLTIEAHKAIADLYGHQETAKLHKDNWDDKLEILREGNRQRGQQNQWTHEDRMEKQALAEAQNFLDLNKAYDFNPETGKEDKVNNSLTIAKMLEATNGDVKQIPKVFRNQAANFQNRFEAYFKSGTLPPGADIQKARRIAWAKFKEKYAPTQKPSE